MPLVAVIACGDTSAPSDIRALNFASLTGGARHTCGSTDVGTTYCWGNNTLGQVGAGSMKDTNFTPLPLPVRPLEFVSVDGGEQLSCGLLNTGVPLCWGNSNSSPRPVAGNHRMRSIGVGDFACGVRLDGSTLCWSDADATPLPVTGPIFTQVSVGGFACGLAEDGTAWCWQQNVQPTAVPDGLSFVAISVGGGHACGIRQDGSGWCWGSNGNGQLGNNTATSSNAPVRISGSSHVWLNVSAGEIHTCGATAAGGGYCWGSTQTGRLGYNGGNIGRLAAPTHVRGPHTPIDETSWSVLAAGGEHSCGTTVEGRTFCWGANESGQLGDGSTDARIAPTPIGPEE